jgi:hypothetical protein
VNVSYESYLYIAEEPEQSDKLFVMPHIRLLFFSLECEHFNENNIFNILFVEKLSSSFFWIRWYSIFSGSLSTDSEGARHGAGPII